MNKPLLPKVAVNGQEISAAEIAAEAQNHAAPQGKPGLAWRAAARALVIRALMLEDSQRLGLVANPQELSPGRIETDEEALLREVMDHSISPARPEEIQIKQAYLASPQQFRAPSLYEPAHILFTVDQSQEGAREKAKAQADATLEILVKSPEKFAGLASELSQCQSAKNGGQLGQITQGDTVPEFEAALQGLAVGEIFHDLVETQYGFHIIRMDAKAVGDVLPYDAVREKISEALEKSAWAGAARDYTATLIRQSKIEGVDFGNAFGDQAQ